MTYRLRLDSRLLGCLGVPRHAARIFLALLAFPSLCVAETPVTTVSALSATSQRNTPFVRIVQRASQSAVNIHTEKRQKSLDVVFSAGKGTKVNGMGTGIIIDERGYIVTNYHVVHEVESLRVTLFDGSSYDAKVVDYDNRRDLAVLKITPREPLPVAPLGTSSDLMLGEDVIAIGNAFGYEGTVSRGIISALNRDVEVNDEQSYDNLIQTDAAINPGNSGGPLINSDGEVIGINVAIRAGAQKIGFAIPIDDARKVVAKLISVELRNKHFHGVLATDQKKGGDRRLVVTHVLPNSPGANAGIRPADVIRKAGSVDVIDLADFERSLLDRKVGEQVAVMVQRDAQTENLTLEIGNAPSERTTPGRQSLPNHNAQVGTPKQVPAAPVVNAANGNRGWEGIGVKLRPVGAADARLTGLPYHGGMEIIDVRNGSPAAANGMQSGDILVGLHSYETVTQDNVDYVLNSPQLRSIRPLKFYIVRKGETLFGNMNAK